MQACGAVSRSYPLLCRRFNTLLFLLVDKMSMRAVRGMLILALQQYTGMKYRSFLSVQKEAQSWTPRKSTGKWFIPRGLHLFCCIWQCQIGRRGVAYGQGCGVQAREGWWEQSTIFRTHLQTGHNLSSKIKHSPPYIRYSLGAKQEALESLQEM